MTDIQNFNLSAANAIGFNPSQELQIQPNLFGVQLYDMFHKTTELVNWNSIATDNNAGIWKAQDEAGTSLKTEMTLDITSQYPIVTTYQAYTTVPARLWGHKEAPYFDEFRGAVLDLLENRVYIQELSQIVWGSMESPDGSVPTSLQSLKSVWNNPMTMQPTGITGTTLEFGIAQAIEAYVVGAGKYPEQLILNEAAFKLLVQDDSTLEGEVVAGYNHLFKIPTFFVPDFTSTNSTPKIVLGDFTKYWLYEPQTDVIEGDIQVESGNDPSRAHKHWFFDFEGNDIKVEMGDIVAGAVMTGSTFLQAEITVS